MNYEALESEDNNEEDDGLDHFDDETCDATEDGDDLIWAVRNDQRMLQTKVDGMNLLIPIFIPCCDRLER